MIYEVKPGKNGRVWFIGKDENDVWVFDPENPNGICGDFKTFKTASGLMQVHGPWASSIDSMKKECL